MAHERAVLERVKSVTSTCVASVVEGDRVAINWVFEFVYHSGKTGRFDEVALQEWRGDRVFASGSSTIRRSRRLVAIC